MLRTLTRFQTLKSSSAKMSHATNSQTQSAVPNAVQRSAPESVERGLPDAIHNTDPNKNVNPNQVDPTKENKNVSHATGPSKVPEGIQKLAPKSLEEALPESIHPTEGANKKL